MSARISVVVPVYNVAAYLETCLESIAQQTMTDLEVVMVEDGSTDESPQIAERFAARDPRFRLVRQANAGLGAARNTGAAHATGEFIAFADSDDVVPPHAYELLLGALDETGSDFASGNVRRLTSLGTSKAGFLARAFERTRLRTHITRFPALLADRTAWNKLFRRSFWDGQGLRFPVGVYYEDTPVTLPAHYLAKSVDVIGETVYLWRMREGADLSITQRRTETKTLRDRVAAVDYVSRFLAEQGLAISKAVYDRSVIGQDLRFFLDVLPSADEDYRRLLLELANNFIDRADAWALEQPLAIDRLKWQLVRRRALPELLEVLRFEDEELAAVPPVRVGRRWYGDYPYRTDARLGIPKRAYRLEDELAPVFRLNDVRWEDETLRIEGYAYVTMLGAASRDSQSVELVARRRDRRRRALRLETEPAHRPDVTATAAQQVAQLDWSGFVAKLDAVQLKTRGRWQEGTWEIGAVIRAGSVIRTSRRAEPASLHAAPSAELSLDDGTHVRAGLGPGGRLTVQVQRRPAVLRSFTVDAGVLQLEGLASHASKRDCALHVSRRMGAVRLEYPVYVDRSADEPAFLARVPLEDLLREVDNVADEAALVEQQADGVVWDLYLAGSGGLDRLTLDDAEPGSTWAVKGREIAVDRTRSGYATVTERSFRPVVSALRWSPAGVLSVEGSFRGPAGEYDIVLSARSRAETYAFPVRYDAPAGRFAAALTPGAVASVDGAHPLGEGLWQLLVRRRGAAPESAAGLVLGRHLFGELPVAAEIGLKRFQLGVLENDAAFLAVERDLDDEERGGFRQRRLSSVLYPAERSGPLRDAVVYDCFGGRAYADNPRAIHQELVRRGAPFEHLWVVRDAAFDVPKTAVPLRHGSLEYFEALAQARYVVANDHFPRWFRRRPEQTCLQTWHGSPLKLQGRLLADRPRAMRAYRLFLGQHAENWQYLVSPGPPATPILRAAFPAGADVLETGLPRTDLLHGPDRDRLAESVKRRLGIAGRRVVLYAPTYRDDLDYRSGSRVGQLRDLPTYRAEVAHRGGYRLGRLLDLAALSSALGDDHVVLFRKHRRIIDPLPADAEPFVRDVSWFPDATELLLAADVLVTDYSSSLFDFAGTGRPIVLFTPDLEAYRDDIRGFSIDLEAEAPGPLLRTTDEVVEALRAADAVRVGFGDRYESFVESYCALDDGHASSRVVDRIFRW